MIPGHDIRAAVDIQGFTGETTGVGRGEKGAGKADIHDVDKLADRRAIDCLVDHQVEILQPRCGTRLERAR